jgi:hypothetical protein
MIQRGRSVKGAAKIAAHLLNEEDNENVEVYEIRGTIANDLHGAMSEMEAAYLHSTKGELAFYGLVINPDEPLTREQFLETIERDEVALGLEGQQRIIVFHQKENVDGIISEHCHALWSRLDINECKSINISHDRMKLQSVTRSIAADYNLKLPDGYQNDERTTKELSHYDRVLKNQTGISKAERMRVVTDIWRGSDTAKAFVAGLDQSGYTLSQGRRGYALVDVFGGVGTVQRLINDRAVRKKDVDAFLEKEFPNDQLPTVEEAKAAAKKFMEQQKHVLKKEQLAERVQALEQYQNERREKLERELNEKRAAIKRETERLDARLDAGKGALAKSHAQADFEINFARTQNDPKGLAKLLAKVSGVEFIRAKLHAHQDQKRHALQEQERKALQLKQESERLIQQRTSEMQHIEINRREEAQKQAFAREQQSLKLANERELVRHLRRGYDHMPSSELTLNPYSGRPANIAKAKTRHNHVQTANEANGKTSDRPKDQLNTQARTMPETEPQTQQEPGDLSKVFNAQTPVEINTPEPPSVPGPAIDGSSHTDRRKR